MHMSTYAHISLALSLSLFPFVQLNNMWLLYKFSGRILAHLTDPPSRNLFFQHFHLQLWRRPNEENIFYTALVKCVETNLFGISDILSRLAKSFFSEQDLPVAQSKQVRLILGAFKHSSKPISTILISPWILTWKNKSVSLPSSHTLTFSCSGRLFTK